MSAGFTRELREEFERFAKREGLDLSRGVCGDLLSAETRKYWLAYNGGWRRSRAVLKAQAKRKAKA